MKKTLKPRLYSPIQNSTNNQDPLATTLGKDSLHWSFTKADRFRHTKNATCPEFIGPPTSLSKRSTSFGFGKRWEPKNEKGRDSPPPTAYNPPSSFTLNTRTANFGAGTPSERTQFKTRLIPGPGTYNISAPTGAGSPKFTFRPRIQLNPKYLAPSPGTYNPSFKVIERSNFSKIGFGYGDRTQISNQEENPGPGSYELPGIFSRTNSRYFAPIRNQTPQVKSSVDETF